MKVSGIYKIESIRQTNLVYIGSAFGISKRWDGHTSKLIRGVHENYLLQEHVNKYGIFDLRFFILAICNKEELIPVDGVIWLEQSFINAYDPWFNIARVAGSSAGILWTEERKRNQSERLKGVNTWSKGKTLTPEHIKKVSKALLGNQYKKGKKESEEACKKKSERLIGNQYALGKHWELPKEFGEKQSERMLGNKYSKGGKKIPILQYDLSMNFIKEWSSGVDASRQLGIGITLISANLRGKIKYAKGFIWKYKNKKDEEKPRGKNRDKFTNPSKA